MQSTLTTSTTQRHTIKAVYEAGHTVITTEDCDGKLCLDRYAFDNFLEKSNIGDKAFSIISISGPARQGKSFLMNLILRYFDREEWHVHNQKTTDDGKYKMNAFRVDSTPACVTTGIRLYNHTFEVKYNKKPMVIILMDTQGIFGGNLKKRDDTFLLTLTTLMSSVQICNTSRDVNMALFDALDTAISYGELAANEDRFLKLQDLFFLLRDQKKNRQIYFDHLMMNEELSDENKVIRDKIRKTFTHVDLFCLPPPGDIVEDLSQEVIEIKMEEIHKKFLEAVQAFLTSTISPIERLKPKLNNGEDPIKLRDLLKLLILCDDMFKKINIGERIDPGKIIEANERVAYEDKYEQAYNEFSEKIQSICGESLGTIVTSYEKLSAEILHNFDEGVSQWKEASEEGKQHEEKYRNKLVLHMQYAISGKVEEWKIQEENRQLKLRLKSEELSDQYVKSVKNCPTVDKLELKTKTFISNIIKEKSETKYDRKHFEKLIDTKCAEMKQRIEEREEEERKAKVLRQEMYEYEVTKLHDQFKMKIRMVKGTTKEMIKASSKKLSVEMLNNFKETVFKWDEKKGCGEDMTKHYIILEQKMKATIKAKVAEWVKRKEEDATFQEILDKVFNEFEQQIKSIDGPSLDELHGSCQRLAEKMLDRYCNKARMDGVSQDGLAQLIAYKEKLREKMESAISQKISEWSGKEQVKHERRRVENIFDEAYDEFTGELMTVEGETEEVVLELCKNLREKTLQRVAANVSKEEIEENKTLLSLQKKLLVISIDDDTRKKITEWRRVRAEMEMAIIRDEMEDAQDDFIDEIEETLGYSEEMMRRLYSDLSIKTIKNFKDRTESALSLELSRNRLAKSMEELRESLDVVAKNKIYEWMREQDMRRRMIEGNLEKRNYRRLRNQWLELMNEKANTKEQTKWNPVGRHKEWSEIKSLSLNDQDMQAIYEDIRRIVLCEYWSNNLQGIEKLSVKYLNMKLLDAWEQITKITGLQSYLPLYPFPDINDNADELRIPRYIDLVNEVVESFRKCLTEDQAKGKFQAGEESEEFCRDYADKYLTMHYDFLNKIFPDLTKEYDNLESLLQKSEKSIVLMREKIQVDIVEKLSICMRKIVSVISQGLNEKLAVYHYEREVLRSAYMTECDDEYKMMYETCIGGCEIRQIKKLVYEASEVQKHQEDLLERNEDNKDTTIFPDRRNIPLQPRNIFRRILDYFRLLFP